MSTTTTSPSGRPDRARRRAARRHDRYVFPDIRKQCQCFFREHRAEAVRSRDKRWLPRLLRAQRREQHAQGTALEPMAFLLNCGCSDIFAPLSTQKPLCSHRARLNLRAHRRAAKQQLWIRIARATQRSAKRTHGKRRRSVASAATKLTDHATASVVRRRAAPCAKFVAAETTTEWLRSESRQRLEEHHHGPLRAAARRRHAAERDARAVFRQDHKFVDAFMVLLASMVAHAPSLVDRVPGAKFLGLIAGDENSYFLRSFDALGLSKAEINAPPAPVTKRFDALMRDAAGSGKLHEMLAVFVVAEWSYLTWGEAMRPSPASRGSTSSGSTCTAATTSRASSPTSAASSTRLEAEPRRSVARRGPRSWRPSPARDAGDGAGCRGRRAAFV